jgi:hypothetical protein
MINARWSAFRCGNFATFNHLKLKVRQEVMKAKIAWTKRVARKDIWNAVNTNMGARALNPIDKLLQNFDSTDEAVESINHTLTAHFQKKLPYSPGYSSVPDWKMNIDEHIVMGLLKKLNSRKASFDIPNALYKEAAIFIARPLALLFTMSIEKRQVPLLWKIGAITPIPKTPKPSIHDVRPISVLPTPAKILEDAVLLQSKHLFIENLDKKQFGFRPGSSTLCALLSLDDHVSQMLDDPLTIGVVVISYDLSKAFDKLPHDQILRRLDHLHFPMHFIEWISSYLHQRQQFVRMGIHSSQPVYVTSGIPQGSILGPLLFVTTVGSYVNESHGHVIKYADDTTLCFPIFKNDVDNCLEEISLEHERIIQWSIKLGLPINEAKSKCMTIKKARICPTPTLPNVQQVDSLRILGITFSSKWNLDDHISKIVTIVSRRIYALRILKNSLSKEQMILAYNAFARSLMEYCAPLFLGLSVTNARRLEKLQKRLHRVICSKSCSEPCFESLSKRREMLSLRFLHKIMQPHHILHFLLPVRSSSGRFRLPCRRTTKRSLSFFPLICETFNRHLTRSHTCLSAAASTTRTASPSNRR